MWGVGPIFLLPTATDSLLGGKKWGAGPTGVVLTMRGRWTYGMLANHVWSVAGDSDRSDISNTFIQPFASYTWPNAWTLSVQSESEYNWKTEKWSVPVNVAVSKLVYLGKLPVSLQGGVGYWLDAPETGPEGWRFRLQANFVLPICSAGSESHNASHGNCRFAISILLDWEGIRRAPSPQPSDPAIWIVD